MHCPLFSVYDGEPHLERALSWRSRSALYNFFVTRCCLTVRNKLELPASSKSTATTLCCQYRAVTNIHNWLLICNDKGRIMKLINKMILIINDDVDINGEKETSHKTNGTIAG